MSLEIENLSNAQTLSIYLSISGDIKAITLNEDTIQSLLPLYKQKLAFYTGNLIPYDNHYGYKKDREELYKYEDLSRLPKIAEYISSISDDNRFSISTDKLENLKFYIVKIPLTQDKSVFVFKKYQTIKRFYGTKPLFFDGTIFKEQDNAKFLLFETNNIDFFIYDNVAYIDSTFFFQAITNENATDFSKAREVIQSINDIVPIQNIDRLINDMENNNNIKRALLNISNNLDVISSITIEGIRNIINDLGLNVEISADNKIVYDSDHKSEILNIFQDNYLTSQTTNSDYRTNSKVKFKREQQ